VALKVSHDGFLHGYKDTFEQDTFKKIEYTVYTFVVVGVEVVVEVLVVDVLLVDVSVVVETSVCAREVGASDSVTVMLVIGATIGGATTSIGAACAVTTSAGNTVAIEAGGVISKLEAVADDDGRRVTSLLKATCWSFEVALMAIRLDAELQRTAPQHRVILLRALFTPRGK